MANRQLAAFLLPDYKFYTLDNLFSKAKSFEYGKAQKYLCLISNRIREAKGDTKKLNDLEDRILNTMQSDNTTNLIKL